MINKLMSIAKGQTHGRLKIISHSGRTKSGERLWKCRCLCGSVTIVANHNLKSGGTKSCGCYRDEKLRDAMLTHGLTGTNAYTSWRNMINRCRNKNLTNFKNYGGRGISVCDRWKSFENFYADMGDRPLKLSLGRIDNNGNYCPENCRWETKKEQTNNVRYNRKIELNGLTLNLSQWSIKTGFKPCTIYARLVEGWPIEKALTKPVRPIRRK